MGKKIWCALATAIIPVVALAPAAGDDRCRGDGSVAGHEQRGETSVVTAPEIDPGAAIGALFLLATGTLILVDRSRHARRQIRD
jgi:hypothetical protein